MCRHNRVSHLWRKRCWRRGVTLCYLEGFSLKALQYVSVVGAWAELSVRPGMVCVWAGLAEQMVTGVGGVNKRGDVIFSAIECTISMHRNMQLPSCLVPEIQFVVVSFNCVTLNWAFGFVFFYVLNHCPAVTQESFFSRCCNVSRRCVQSSNFPQCTLSTVCSWGKNDDVLLLRLFDNTLRLAPCHMC